MKKIILFLAGLLISVSSFCYSTSDQLITEVKSKGFYEVDFLSSSKITKHSMELNKNANVKFSLKKECGKIIVKVLDNEGKLVYKGNKDIKNKTFEVLKSGIYNVIIETKNATGKVFIETL